MSVNFPSGSLDRQADAPSRLAAAELVELSGTDAATFAHTQFSSDVSALAAGDWQWSAWLNAQGRARHVFALLRPQSQQLIAWLPLGTAVGMAAQLARFVLRAKVTVRALGGWVLSEMTTEVSSRSELLEIDHGWAFEMPGNVRRCAALRFSHSPVVEAADNTARLVRWRLADIAAGMPWIADELSGVIVGPALGLAQFGAASTNKGCYPGQEIVARLHFRGGNKSHLLRITVAADAAPEPGAVIFADSVPSHRGVVLYSAPLSEGRSAALAVLPEVLGAATDLRLACGSHVEPIGGDFLTHA